MPFNNTALAGVSATAAGLLLLQRQQHERQVAERFAAASLEALLNAIDANDAATGVHVRRVATYSLILAHAAELSDHDCKIVERVALFHDIGKIHEALFDITHDDAKLTAADRRAIATHPQRGAQVLSPLNGFYPELPEGVLAHHERWDGTGYPRRLKGRRIPFSSRFVAIADTFDAVTHSRRYRAAQSLHAGFRVIAEGRGTQFDPDLVDLFLFPPVADEITAAMDETSGWTAPVHSRRAGKDEQDVPDVTFRWRPGRTGSHGHAATDRPRRTAR